VKSCPCYACNNNLYEKTMPDLYYIYCYFCGDVIGTLPYDSDGEDRFWHLDCEGEMEVDCG